MNEILNDRQLEQRTYCQNQIADIDFEQAQVDAQLDVLLAKQNFLENQRAKWLGRIAQIEGTTPERHLYVVK